MFVSSIGFYLSVKKLQVLGADKRYITLANYIFPTIIFFFLALINHERIIFPLTFLLSIMVLRVLFNYIGTIAGYKSMEEAPNAGYSLVIQKSYAIYTLFAAALIYGSEVSIKRFIISGFILFCASLVAFSKSTKTTKSYRWAWYALLAMISFGSISLSSKYFAAHGISASSQLFWTCLFTLIITISDSVRVKLPPIKLTRQLWIYMTTLGLGVSGFYFFKLLAELAAPNLGYVGAINAASNAVYTVIVAKIFGDSLSPKKTLAIIGMTFGLILLLFS
jgi:drug/metabolite transporter (DMT)-like permease